MGRDGMTETIGVLTDGKLNQKIHSLVQKQQWAEAQTEISQLLKTSAHTIDILMLAGVIAYHNQNFIEGVRYYQQVIKRQPKLAAAYFHRAFCLIGLSHYQEAIADLGQAIQLNPKEIQYRVTLASVYLNQQQLAKAKKTLLSIKNWAQLEKARELLGTVELCGRRNGSAKTHYLSVLKINPNNQTALCNLGKIYAEEGQLQQAFAILQQALQRYPTDPNLYNSLGNLCLLVQQQQKAIHYFNQAIALSPNFRMAWTNLSLTLLNLGDTETASSHLERLVMEATSHDYLWCKAVAGYALSLKTLADFKQLQSIQPLLEKAIDQCLSTDMDAIMSPFQAYMLDLPLAVTASLTKKFTAHFEVKHQKKSTPQKPKGKIRLGYLSGDFADHAVGLLISSLFKYHDSSRFEVFAITLAGTSDDPLQRMVENSVQAMVDVSKLDYPDDKAQIEALALDILVDLSGLTERSRPRLLQEKLAPVMLHWVGYPGTLETQAIDYYLTHPIHMTPFHQAQMKEQLVYLPKTLISVSDFPNENQCQLRRADFGLPDSAFVYCCFSRAYRLSWALIEDWAYILDKVEHAVLWLNDEGETFKHNIKAHFEGLGIHKQRLIFSPPAKLTQDWRHRLADVWLDAYDISSGTSLLLALKAGLPVVTKLGDKPQARMGATIVAGANQVEMIVSTREEYRALAVHWGNSPKAYQNQCQKLNAKLPNSPICQLPSFVRELEIVYQRLIDVRSNQRK